MKPADADRPSYARITRRREADIEFLARVRAADLVELRKMRREHRKGPAWKLVSIERRIARRMAETKGKT